ncbi:MAG: asparagine synthase (glutamine-hydrolyzing) [Saprospiraceae bacterium]
MCGIAGILSPTPADLTAIRQMTAALAHRGPDDQGTWSVPGIALGHRRLSIIDLSAAGHQPMLSADGRYVLVYNGELYNFRELRAELADYPFRSHTDSEVILAAYARWGLQALQRFNGMYAFALYDCHRGVLMLVRDRLGIKPLYYHLDGDRLLFASEVRALAASNRPPLRLSPAGVHDYLRYQTVHAPDSILEGVSMLPAGAYLEYALGKAVPKPVTYWIPEEDAFRAPTPTRTRTQWQTAVRDTLQGAVEKQLVADVPFGAFLSGGIDSSALVALMAQCGQSVKTFTVSFAEQAYDEARYAQLVADKFKTDHTEIRLHPDDFLHALPKALASMDHPSGDGPNTWVVARATKQAGITMALSGLGGDELFAGYPIFTRSVRLQRLRGLNALPRALRVGMGDLLMRVRPGVAAAKMAKVLSLDEVSPLTAYPLNRQVFLDAQLRELLRDEPLPNRVAAMTAAWAASPDFRRMPLLSQISVAEMSTYMQNVLLRDTDQMAMAHALEVRVPFLDHELVELALQIPDSEKYPHTPKQLLVESLGDLLPAEIVNRPKMGFILPYDVWMRRELRDFCSENLEFLGELPLFRPGSVAQRWQLFLEGDPTTSWSRLWSLTVLGYWVRKAGVQG